MPSLFAAEFFLFLNTGPLNTAIVNSVSAPVRATAISINLFCIHFFGDTFSPSIIGAITDRSNLSIGLGATLVFLLISLHDSLRRRALRAAASGEARLRYLPGSVSWSFVFINARVATLRAQVGIVNRRPLLIGGKAARQQGIGLELGRSTVELPGMAQDHSGAPMHRLNDPAKVHIGVAVSLQFAHLAAILSQAHDRKPALVVGSLRRTQVQESCAIRKLHHFINMRRNTNVFVEHLRAWSAVTQGFGLAARVRAGRTQNQSEARDGSASAHQQSP